MDQSSPSASAADTFMGMTPEIRANNRRMMFSFNGRVSRTAYWPGGFLPPFVYSALAGAFDLPARMGSFGFFVFGLLVIWVALAVGAKRCHDRDRSGWFQLITLIPIVGSIWLIVELGFLTGTEGENRFGAAVDGQSPQ